MWISSRYAFLGLVTITGCFFAAPAETPVVPRMPQFIEQYTADSKSLRETYTVLISPVRMARFEKFYNDEVAALAAMDFDSLSQEDKVDYLLLKNRLNADLHQLAIERQQTADMQTFLPFAETFGTILEQKRLMQRPDAEKDAAALTAMVKQMDAARARLDPKPQAAAKPKINPVTANRALLATEKLRSQLKDWFDQNNGYDPLF